MVVESARRLLDVARGKYAKKKKVGGSLPYRAGLVRARLNFSPRYMETTLENVYSNLSCPKLVQVRLHHKSYGVFNPDIVRYMINDSTHYV